MPRRSRAERTAPAVKSLKALENQKRARALQELIKHYSYQLPDDWDKRHMGRPHVVTARVVRKLEQAFAFDCTAEEACAFAGIYPARYYDFLEKCPDFSETVEQLRKIPFLIAKKTLVTALIDNPHKALEYLERREPGEYAPLQKHQHGGKVMIGHIVKQLESEDEKLEQPEHKAPNNVLPEKKTETHVTALMKLNEPEEHSSKPGRAETPHR